MSDDERTPLHWAVVNNDLMAVQEHLRNGEDPDQADDAGWTPLMSAASAGYAHIADALIQADANAKLRTAQGRTAFFYAVSKCHVQVIDLFIQNDLADWKKDRTGSNPVHRAISNKACTPEILQMLLQADAPFNVADGEGNTPIHLACYENRKDLVKWLEENTGASTKKPKNDDGKIPMELLPSVEWNA